MCARLSQDNPEVKLLDKRLFSLMIDVAELADAPDLGSGSMLAKQMKYQQFSSELRRVCKKVCKKVCKSSAIYGDLPSGSRTARHPSYRCSSAQSELSHRENGCSSGFALRC